MTEDEMLARIAIAERERNHMAEELEHIMDQRDRAFEELDDIESKYKFKLYLSFGVIALVAIVGFAF